VLPEVDQRAGQLNLLHTEKK